jgi:hypothetical protein
VAGFEAKWPVLNLLSGALLNHRVLNFSGEHVPLRGQVFVNLLQVGPRQLSVRFSFVCRHPTMFNPLSVTELFPSVRAEPVHLAPPPHFEGGVLFKNFKSNNSMAIM